MSMKLHAYIRTTLAVLHSHAMTHDYLGKDTIQTGILIVWMWNLVDFAKLYKRKIENYEKVITKKKKKENGLTNQPDSILFVWTFPMASTHTMSL